MRAANPLHNKLLAIVVLSTCIGLIGGGLAAWAIYARFGPVERVETPPINVSGNTGGGLSVAAIAQQAQSSVVEIAIHKVQPQSLLNDAADFVDGFVVSSDGLIITSIHALRGATALTVATSDGRVFQATIARSDPSHGITLLRAAKAQGLTPLAFATQEPRPGDLSVVVAHTPFTPMTLSTGVVSSTGRTLTLNDGEPVLSDVMTVDATPDPREDGAPMLSGAGNVAGVVVDTGGAAPGVVALSGKAASDLVQQVTGGGAAAAAPTLGVASIVIDAATAAASGVPAGALVRSVDPGGPAAQAGIAAGDVVTAVDGVTIDFTHPFDAVALGLTPSQQVSVTLWRSGSTQTVPLTVGAAGSTSG